MKCDVCRRRIDPVAAPVHPACEDTAEAQYIRSQHPSTRLREATPVRFPRLSRHNPALEQL